MNTTRLSSKGQVIIPKGLRTAHHWEAGQELIAIDVGDGILLKSRTPFEVTSIDDVANCLKYDGETKSLDDMDEAIQEGLKGEFR